MKFAFFSGELIPLQNTKNVGLHEMKSLTRPYNPSVEVAHVANPCNHPIFSPKCHKNPPD